MLDNKVGNWRNHTLVKCAKCRKPMGFHIISSTAICVECELNNKIKETKND